MQRPLRCGWVERRVWAQATLQMSWTGASDMLGGAAEGGKLESRTTELGN